ncbi:MAG: hypothetical protein ACE5ID_10595 [Acidobacteriota bacterium]
MGLGPLLLVPALLLRPLALPCAASTDEGTGRAAAVMVDFDEGFYLEEVTPHSSRRWMEGPGQIRLCETGSSGGLWDLELNLASFAVPRNLLVRAGGVPILKTEIAPWTTPVKLQNLDLGHGPLSLTFSVQPGPQRVDPILHNGDRRPVSLQFMGSPVLAKEHPAPEPSASPETDGGPGEPP